MQRSNSYIILFAAAVCLVCSVFVAFAAVTLKERQDVNAVLDRQKKVLIVADLLEEKAYFRVREADFDALIARLADEVTRSD